MKNIRRLKKAMLAAVLSAAIVLAAIPRVASAAAIPLAADGLIEVLVFLGMAWDTFGGGSDSLYIERMDHMDLPEKTPVIHIGESEFLCGNGDWRLTPEYAAELQGILDSNVLADKARQDKIRDLFDKAGEGVPTWGTAGELYRQLTEGKNEVAKKKQMLTLLQIRT